MNLLKTLMIIPSHLWFSVVGILGIGFLIGFHELGHFLFAKLFHVHTPSFSIGFGPKLISKKIGQTTFSLSAIPLGGYVEVAGMAEMGQGEQKDATSKEGDSFAVKPYWQRFLILFGGIFFNLLFAYTAITALLMLGAPTSAMLSHKQTPIIHHIADADTPAAQADLRAGDEITQVNDVLIHGDIELLKEQLALHPNETVNLTIKRDEQLESIPVTLGSRRDETTNKEVGILGVFFASEPLPRMSFLPALKKSFEITNASIVTIAKSFGNMFSKRDLSNVGGPLSVISQTIKGAQQGWKIFLLLLAIISINLAVLNLLPLPILDGGQILFTTIEAIIRRPLPLKIREYIHMASWFLILGLMLYLTIKDIGIFKWLGFSK